MPVNFALNPEITRLVGQVLSTGVIVYAFYAIISKTPLKTPFTVGLASVFHFMASRVFRSHFVAPKEFTSALRELDNRCIEIIAQSRRKNKK